MLRILALLLALFVPLQAVATAWLHEHGHNQAAGVTAPQPLIHVDEACADEQDPQNEDCETCAIVHVFCHLGLLPGLSGRIDPVGLEGEHCLHAAVLAAHALAPPESFRRPPLARA